MRLHLAIALLWLTASPALAGDLARSFAAGSGGRLVIALDFGSVDVVRHDGDEVRIEATSRGVGASGVRFAAHSDGSDVFLAGDAEPWVHFMHSQPGVRVRAQVPEDYRVEVESSPHVDVAGTLVVPGPIR